MDIVVCVKQVPDTWAEKKLTDTDKTVDRANAEGVMNEIDEYAVEEALRLTEAHGGEVTVLTMGPEKAAETIRKALSMGAHKAIHLSDEGLHGACAIQTSYALGMVLQDVQYDLVIMGSESTDARLSIMPALLAERLQLPHMTYANKVEADPAAGTLTVHRVADNGYEVVESTLPAVVSVVEKTNEPRYPSFKGIMAAKKKPMTTMTMADAGLDPEDAGLDTATSKVDDFATRPPRQAGQIVKDEGDGGTKVAEFLASQKLI